MRNSKGRGLTFVGYLNSSLLTIILSSILFVNWHIVNQYGLFTSLYYGSQREVSSTVYNLDMTTTNNENTNRAKEKEVFKQDRSMAPVSKLNMQVGSLTDSNLVKPLRFQMEKDDYSTIQFKTAVVFLSDDTWINGTISAIYNLREPSLGAWTHGDVIILGYKINFEKRPQLYRYFNCLNIKFLDISNDPLRDEFNHLHFWKNYIILHDWFRNPSSPNYIGQNYKYVLYLDSDVFTIRHWDYLIIDKILPSMRKAEVDFHNGQRDTVYVGWREDYRHKSMYKAVIDVRKYDEKTLNDLKKEYPDYPEAKQANVVFFNMEILPSVEYLKSEINRIYGKYGKAFWRNDQSLWNLLFYHNASDLGFSAFNKPPDWKLFYTPNEYFPLVHTGGHNEAMWKIGGQYHVLHEFWMYKLLVECPMSNDMKQKANDSDFFDN